MSGASWYSLNQRVNSLQAQINNISPVPPPVGGYVTVAGNQTLTTGVKTFTNLPECVAVPTTNGQLVNKLYVDNFGMPNLQQVCDDSNTLSNFIAPSTASITSTNFVSNRQLLLNANADPTIKMIDNLNASHFTTFDIDTLNLNGVSTNWSAIVAGSTIPTITQVLTAGNNGLDVSQIFSATASTTTTNIDDAEVQLINSSGGLYSLLEYDKLTIVDNAGSIHIVDSGGDLITGSDATYNYTTSVVGVLGMATQRTNITTSAFELGAIDFIDGISYTNNNNPATTNNTTLSMKASSTLGTIRCINGGIAPPSLAPINFLASSLSLNSIPFAPATTPNLSAVLTVGNTANTSINMNNNSINNVSTLNNIQAGLVYTPQLNLTANSNANTFVPVYGGDHQILLRASAPVPLIDTFVVQPQFIGSASVICSHISAGVGQWLGTSSGEVYMFDTVFNNWFLITQLNGSVNALYYHTGSSALWIGGAFTNCSNPAPSGTVFNYVCYISSPTITLITPSAIVWAGAIQAGFNNNVNAITADNNDIYFGGDFTADADINIICAYFADYHYPSNNLYSLNTTAGTGFDGAVNNLDFLSGTICATGSFTNMIYLGTYYSPSCITFQISGYNVGTIFQFDGGLGNLSSPIPGYDLIKNDGTDFFVGAGSNVYGVMYYFFRLSLSCIPSVYGIDLPAPLTNFYWNAGVIYSVDAVAYYQDGTLISTIPWASYIFFFYNASLIYFNNQGVGSQWAFNGNTYNTFVLQGSRVLKIGNGHYSNIFCNTPYVGYSWLINWDGSYYIPVGVPFPNFGSTWSGN